MSHLSLWYINQMLHGTSVMLKWLCYINQLVALHLSIVMVVILHWVDISCRDRLSWTSTLHSVMLVLSKMRRIKHGLDRSLHDVYLCVVCLPSAGSPVVGIFCVSDRFCSMRVGLNGDLTQKFQTGGSQLPAGETDTFIASASKLEKTAFSILISIQNKVASSCDESTF